MGRNGKKVAAVDLPDRPGAALLSSVPEGVVKRIATHSKPDADAIAAAWLAETFVFPGEEVEVVFLPRPRPGQPGPAADCLVDVGCTFDPERLIFDHKPPAFANRNSTSATRLVWEHVLSLGRPVRHLEALVRVVHEGDLSPPRRPTTELATSRSEGFHFHLKQARSRGGDDLRLYQEMRAWLDRYDREERAKCQPVRTRGPNGNRWTLADVKSLDASVGIGVPQATTSVSTGEAGVKRTAQDHQSSADVLPPTPSPATGDDGLRSLEALLLDYVCLYQRDEASGRVAQSESADRGAAVRG